ncbi:DUF6283 family protein [Pseudomonas sp. UMAB-40]|uniref:DUF6283 family protein n=1 Tax=Pseudomonas sp. UMAB-40 TaxID=1365407 RepID=UPI001C58E56B|nr:DUF6283 family protein [Pseudomonas sp. UMAB-40]
MTKIEIIETRAAGDEHQVVTFSRPNGGARDYRRKPCKTCPWRRDAAGEFPAEAFRHSARTAYDMAIPVFSCHSGGTYKPATCAGFLMRGADHNLSVRLAYHRGEIGNDLDDNGLALFDSYREMAIANGVDPDDPTIKPCR